MTDVQKRTGATSRRWGQERRFEFIDFRLLWDGRLNRADLTSYFGISVPQASMDLALYQQLAPDNTIYDKQQKAYVIGPAFRPLTEPLSAYPFLNSMRQVQTGMLPKESTFLGWCPPNGVVQLPTRRIEVDILRQALASIRINSVTGMETSGTLFCRELPKWPIRTIQALIRVRISLGTRRQS